MGLVAVGASMETTVDLEVEAFPTADTDRTVMWATTSASPLGSTTTGSITMGSTTGSPLGSTTLTTPPPAGSPAA